MKSLQLFVACSHHKGKLAYLIAVILVLSFTSVEAGGFYSYVDENGVRVLTNLGARRAQSPSSAAVTEDSQNFAPLIRDYSAAYGIDEDLVRAIIKVESNFDPRAVSHKNCKGLMQLHPDTAKRFGVTDIFDPAANIEGGVKYLDFLMKSFDRQLDLVLAAYNAGENAVRRYEGVPPYSETLNYVDKVKNIFGEELVNDLSRRPRKIQRLVDAAGNVLLTNTLTY